MFSYLIVIFIFVQYAHSNTMLYKRNPDDVYERDLVAVSSTVIPLSIVEVSYGSDGKPSEAYEKAYLKKLLKKLQHKTDTTESEFSENSHSLITLKNKHQDYDATNNDHHAIKIKTAAT